MTDATAGTGVGSFDIDNGVTSIESPDIVLPTADTITLSFQYYFAHLNNATSDDFFRATLVGSSNQVLVEELGSGNDDAGAWELATADISAFSGQTVRLRFEAADAAGGSLAEAGVDDVLIRAESVTQVTPTATPDPPTETPVLPTETPVPPTATPVLPTTTPVTPTATPVIPTATPVTPTATPVPPTATPVTPTPTAPPPVGDDVVYVSSSSGGNASGVGFSDEDILSWDSGTGQWAMVLTAPMSVSAARVRVTQTPLLTGRRQYPDELCRCHDYPDVGSIDDSDIVRFVPSLLGTATAGTFETVL